MEITKRTEDIIRIILEFTGEHPVSTNLIAEKLNVSTRSIQREMIYVEEWMEEYGFKLKRKRGAGLWLEESEEKKQMIQALLGNNDESDQNLYDRDKRLRQIRLELLQTDEPLKIYYLTEKCDVSEGTLLNDLNQLTAWFRKHNLNLVRRTGLGIFVSGDELEKRRALATTICDIIESSYSLGQYNRDSIHNHLKGFSEIDLLTAEIVNSILYKYESNLDLSFTDGGYIRILINIILTVHRIQKGKTIIIDDNEQNEIFVLPEYGIAEGIMTSINKELNLPIPRDEICALAIQLSSTRSLPKSKKNLTINRDFNIHRFVVSLIREVSKSSMIDFTKDVGLANDLSIHIQPAIGRLRAKIPIENPLLENLQEDYPDIYAACQEACEKVFYDILSMEEVPSSEVGFVTMHFAAAMERKEKNERRIRVVIVCPTGIGSSRLLSADLRLAYPMLDIVRTQSAFDIDQRKLLQEGIELIISTAKLDVTFRYVQVNTILTKHDKALINSRIEYLLRQKKTEFVPVEAPQNSIRKSDIDYISLVGDTIYELLDSLEIYTAPIIHNRDELIQYASMVCVDDPETIDTIFNVLKTRDELADTYIKPFHALLLHGKCDIIDKPTFGYIRLEPPFYESGKVILGAILSLIPSEGIKNKVSTVVTSEIIGSLIDSDQLLAAMRSGNIGLLHDLIENRLLDFYKRHVAEILDLPYDD